MALALIALGISFAGMTVAFIAAMQRRNYWRSQAGHWEDMTHGAAASLKIADNAARPAKGVAQASARVASTHTTVTVAPQVAGRASGWFCVSELASMSTTPH